MKFYLYFSNIIVATILTSCLLYTRSHESGTKEQTVHSQENIQVFEAENMILKNYQIDSDSLRTYVKLTDSTGVASFQFPFSSGYYDIDVCYQAESVGSNTYTLLIANNQIVSWLGKARDNQWHKLSEQKWHVPRHIEINKGDDICIEALSKNGSFVIFDHVQFTPSTRVVAPRELKTSTQATGQIAAIIASSPNDYITVRPEEYEHAIKNPLKGFRPYELDHEFGTLVKTYFRWNELENVADDGVDQIIKVCNTRWHSFEKTNMKAIPRVYLDWPGRNSGWPADLKEGDYTSDEFKERVVRLIQKMGQAWDNDPRVAYIEMGLIGEWGEMEYPDTRLDIKEAIAAQFDASFKNKLVMIRWPNTYNDHLYNFGYYWDSFAHLDQEYYAFHLEKTSPKWETSVIGGEPAFDWGNVSIQPGINPNVSLQNPVHRNYIINRIRKLHANHLGWISSYDQNNELVRAGAEIMQKTLGYRFVLTEVTYPKTIDFHEPFVFSFKVKNTGSSPFYYNWPVEVSLLNPDTKKVIWKKQCTDVDIRRWLPGDQWDEATQEYAIQAQTYTVNQTMTLKDVAPGEYILSLSILDPAGNQPSARFAINNYYNGGRHPIGRLGVNQAIETFTVADFDDVQRDNSLFYELPKE